ncbi:MAG: hypothetical protein LKH33_10410 [Acetobacter sp.]|jgi:phage FluMu gp28-like protein|nr:hypothetical protein [Acetobacter sp.]MCH4060552.1 hypothetical protein [Acetobacter sp.]MCH4087492.1 hypothetical protein [Acetobacter sp.]MCI1294693.1 hypothetical protein [Acetobacter sp.]MCI1321158.1 hypothetical protein [Acetobacter sp.]
MSAPAGIFLAYQSTTMRLTLENPVAVVEKSRRTGLSWAASFIADLLGGMSADAGGMDVFYMGYNLEMAREFIDYCAEHMEAMQVVASEVCESFFRDPDKPDQDVKVFRIDLGSGHKILALPSMPRALRGMQGLVIIDEAAFHDDLEELLKAALALLMWGGKVLIISTHNGDTNPFCELVTNIRAGRKPYALQRITFDDALRDGLFRKICERKGDVWSPEAEEIWRAEIIAFYGDAADEELFCIPKPSTGAYIPLAVIEARSVPDAPVIRWSCNSDFTLLPENIREAETRRFFDEQIFPVIEALDPKTPHVFGEDFGRSGDLTVLWFLSLERSLLRRTVFVLELRNVPFEQQKQILFLILDRIPRFRAGKMDARGNGQYLAEVAAQRYGTRIEEVMLSEGWYRENMPPFKAAMEDGTLTIPADRDIHDDIRALKIVRGVARVPDSRTSDKNGKRHGDAAIAIAMAWAASRAEPEEYGYIPVPNPLAPDMSGQRRLNQWPVEDEIARERMGMRSVYGLRGSVRI